jgi:hypothetical protein
MILTSSTGLLAMEAVVEMGEYGISGRSENKYDASVESVEAVVVECASAISSGFEYEAPEESESESYNPEECGGAAWNIHEGLIIGSRLPFW